MLAPVSDDAKDRSDRALSRRAWPGALRRLEDDDGGLVRADPGELIASVTALTLSAWAMMDRALPSYSRTNAPGRVIRPGDK